MTTSEPVPAWTVTGQRQSFATVDGRPAAVWIVSFRTSTGIDGQVTVAQGDYTPNKVAAMITEQVDAIAAVHALQGPPT